MPILTAHPTASSIDLSVTGGVVDPTSPFVGVEAVLVSGLQTTNNSRIVFSGAADLFSDAAFNYKIKDGSATTGNRMFVSEVFKWVCKEKTVLRFENAHHHKQGDTVQRGI